MIMRQIFFTLLLFVFSSATSLLGARYIAERFFFDLFFYQKSVAHGYWLADRGLTLEDFGKRAEDLRWLQMMTRERARPDGAVLGTFEEDIFTVAVLGDSFVWGQGLREEERFVSLLEKKLSDIAPVEIVSLGYPGDSMLDNYVKYDLLLASGKHFDLVVMGLVFNDLLLRRDPPYSLISYTQILDEQCHGPYIYDPRENGLSATDELYMEQVRQSLANPGNVCVLEKVLDSLPRDRVIYFDFWNLLDDEDVPETVRQLFITKVIDVVAPQTAGSKDVFSPVSKKEAHPSARANEVFAQMLYEIIININEGR